MVAHLDAVTSLAIDPNGIYLMSGSKYYLHSCKCLFLSHMLLKQFTIFDAWFCFNAHKIVLISRHV